MLFETHPYQHDQPIDSAAVLEVAGMYPMEPQPQIAYILAYGGDCNTSPTQLVLQHFWWNQAMVQPPVEPVDY